ncbi:MAG: nucleotidyl transferase AbiEii/AbiGii toxin family protein [Terrimicrobiaceae bacterium]
MISPRCFEEAWIREQAAALRARDLRTLEKSVLAMELVSRLRRGGLDFIFNGGTSLALFFEQVCRLSTDVDILSLEPI